MPAQSFPRLPILSCQFFPEQGIIGTQKKLALYIQHQIEGIAARAEEEVPLWL